MRIKAVYDFTRDSLPLPIWPTDEKHTKARTKSHLFFILPFKSPNPQSTQRNNEKRAAGARTNSATSESPQQKLSPRSAHCGRGSASESDANNAARFFGAACSPGRATGRAPASGFPPRRAPVSYYLAILISGALSKGKKCAAAAARAGLLDDCSSPCTARTHATATTTAPALHDAHTPTTHNNAHLQGLLVELRDD